MELQKYDFTYSSLQTGGILAVVWLVYLAAKTTWRLYVHPLSRFPGPKIFAVTSLVNTYYVFKLTRAYKVSELHNQYGPVVRIGPNELSYIDERAWKDIYAYKPELQKHMPADTREYNGLFRNPNDAQHARYRKLLSTGFSEKAIRDRESIIGDFVALMIAKVGLEAKKGEKTDLCMWLNCVGIDVAAKLAFGEEFHALEKSTLPPVVGLINSLLSGLSIGLALGQYPITSVVGNLLRKLSPLERDFEGTMAAKVTERTKRLQAREKENEVPDYFSFLARDKELPSTALVSVATDLVVAGADTTATVQCGAIYLLLKNLSKLAILMQEVRSTFESEDDITIVNTNSLKYLTAVINETMRLFPAAAETTRRITNKGGNTICGEFVPGGTFVGVYHWAAGHNAASWKDVESFVPERWLGDSRYDGDVRGVVNFWNAGPRNCIGQNLAMAVMRLVLTRLLWNFDLELCRESDDWMNVGTSVLVYDKGPLMVRLKSIRS